MVHQNPMHLKASTPNGLQQPMSDKLAYRRFWVIDLPDHAQGMEVKSRGFGGEGAETDEAVASLFVQHIRASLQKRSDRRDVAVLLNSVLGRLLVDKHRFARVPPRLRLHGSDRALLVLDDPGPAEPASECPQLRWRRSCGG